LDNSKTDQPMSCSLDESKIDSRLSFHEFYILRALDDRNLKSADEIQGVRNGKQRGRDTVKEELVEPVRSEFEKLQSMFVNGISKGGGLWGNTRLQETLDGLVERELLFDVKGAVSISQRRTIIHYGLTEKGLLVKERWGG